MGLGCVELKSSSTDFGVSGSELIRFWGLRLRVRGTRFRVSVELLGSELGFTALGFRGLGFRALRLGGLGFRVYRLRVYSLCRSVRKEGPRAAPRRERLEAPY